jgi:hypothetical protein
VVAGGVARGDPPEPLEGGLLAVAAGSWWLAVLAPGGGSWD